MNAPAGQPTCRCGSASPVTGTELGLACILALAGGGTGHWLLDRRRLADWDRAWQATAPLWTAGPR